MQATGVHRATDEYAIPHGATAWSSSASASVGLATCPPENDAVHAIIGAADARMYEVKSNGRGKVRGEIIAFPLPPIILRQMNYRSPVSLPAFPADSASPANRQTAATRASSAQR